MLSLKRPLYKLVYCFTMLIVINCNQIMAQDHEQKRAWQKDRTSDEPLNPRIIGGTTVQQGSRSYQVMLLDNRDELYCGGSIISDNWVLTAAHCLTDNDVVRVRAGFYRQSSNDGNYYTIAQTVIHPGFSNNFGTGDDIALLRINGEFPSNLSRLKLPTQAALSASGQPGNFATVSGWGRISGGSQQISDSLLQTSMEILSDNQCANLQGNFNTAAVICGFTSGRSSCNGDSGGPWTISYGNEDYSLGIVSYGPGDRCEGFSAYAETSNYISWIGQYVNTGNPPPPPPPPPPSDGSLKNDQAVLVSGSRGQEVFYSFVLPDNVSTYTVRTSGGSGDADLYLRKDQKPSTFDFDCRPYRDGNEESCSQTYPDAGTYHVMIKGWQNFSNVSLKLTYTTSVTGSCPAGHTEYNGYIGSSGIAKAVGGVYLSTVQGGIHSVINLGGTDINMALLKWTKSVYRYEARETSSSRISYPGRRGHYRVDLTGRPGTAYQICLKMP